MAATQKSGISFGLVYFPIALYTAGGMTSLLLGQYQGSELIYKGHVTLGVSGSSFRRIATHPKIEKPSFDPPKGNENAAWI